MWIKIRLKKKLLSNGVWAINNKWRSLFGQLLPQDEYSLALNLSKVFYSKICRTDIIHHRQELITISPISDDRRRTRVIINLKKRL